MGWKGTVRSINSAMRQMEREAQRRQRELERQLKQARKEEEKAHAALEVEAFENRISLLTSVHAECSQPIEWQAMADAQPPVEPSRSDSKERKAQHLLDTFAPSVWDKVMKQQDKKLARLKRSVELAEKEDEEAYHRAQQRHLKEYSDWKETRDLARRVVGQEAAGFLEALEKLDPFTDISELGSRMSFDLSDGLMHATLHVHAQQVIPKESKSLLKSGKLSVKEMPKTKYYAVHQDYVCSCALRVAGELLAILPIDAVLVTAVDSMLNSSTGLIEDQAILSLAVPRATLERLNLEAVDPSDCMENFVHNMDFKKTKGFGPVGPVDASQLSLSRLDGTERRTEVRDSHDRLASVPSSSETQG